MKIKKYNKDETGFFKSKKFNKHIKDIDSCPPELLKVDDDYRHIARRILDFARSRGKITGMTYFKIMSKIYENLLSSDK